MENPNNTEETFEECCFKVEDLLIAKEGKNFYSAPEVSDLLFF